MKERPVVEVRLLERHWRELEGLLLGRRDVETKCFALCKSIERRGSAALLVRELVGVPDEAYQQRSASSVVVRREFVHALLVRCAEEELSLVEAHTHPWGASARFSSIDLSSDPQKFRATQVMAPPFRHAALVFGSDMSFDGHIWDRRQQGMVPVDRIKVVGETVRVLRPSWAEPSRLAQAQREIYDRQIRAFGETGQEALRGLTVGIVGLGGLGSQVAQALALLGVGRFILVDPDSLEATNANRVVCVTSRQVAARLPKVTAIARTLRRIAPVPPLCTSLRAAVAERRAWQALLWSDVIVGAVDSPSARQFMNLISVCGLVPYLDGGVGVQALKGEVVDAGGQVQTILPGTGFCMTCINQDVGQLVEEQLTPHQREMSRQQGYIHGERVPNPQVVFLNGVVANLLVWELVKLVTGCLPVERYVYYDLVRQDVFSASGAERREDCLTCSANGLLGMGGDALRGFSGAPTEPRDVPVPSRRHSE